MRRARATSDESAVGGVLPEVIVDNRGAWTGDHCMDPERCPASCSRIVRSGKPAATLRDLAPALLAELGIDGFPSAGEGALNMFGSSIKLDKALLARVKRMSDLAGYSSVNEFITHALEKELQRLESGDGTDEEIKKRLKGLGYIS